MPPPMTAHLTADQIDRYLARLGIEQTPPSIESLFALHRAQIERIPYESTWIHLGEHRSIDEGSSVAFLVDAGRGGYCFHLNGAFGALLRALGFRVEVHVGVVCGDLPDASAFGNHMVLTVSGLSTEANPSGNWYVDTGLGDGLYEPLPLLVGRYRQGPMEFHLSQPTDGVGDWRLTHDPKGAFVSMSWQTRTATVDEFEVSHTHLSTSPDSPFVQTVCVQRRNATTLTALRALTLSTITGDGKRKSILDDRVQWFAALHDIFDLRLDNATDAACDLLWRSANESHVRHLARKVGPSETAD